MKRSVLGPGKNLRVKMSVVPSARVARPQLRWMQLGNRSYNRFDFQPVRRGTFSTMVPASCMEARHF